MVRGAGKVRKFAQARAAKRSKACNRDLVDGALQESSKAAATGIGSKRRRHRRDRAAAHAAQHEIRLSRRGLRPLRAANALEVNDDSPSCRFWCRSVRGARPQGPPAASPIVGVDLGRGALLGCSDGEERRAGNRLYARSTARGENPPGADRHIERVLGDVRARSRTAERGGLRQDADRLGEEERRMLHWFAEGDDPARLSYRASRAEPAKRGHAARTGVPSGMRRAAPPPRPYFEGGGRARC